MKGSLTTLCVGFLCGLVIYKIFKRIADDDVVSDAETSDHTVTVSVANRLEELYGGTAYVGLRIPDPETRSLQNIDIVLVKNGEAVVTSVKNFSGLVSINNDGSWVCMGEAVHPNPVMDEVKNQASILESYLEQRGIPAGERCLSCKVILPNPKLRPISLNLPEVITYDQLTQLKPDHPKLNFILQTAPMWDRYASIGASKSPKLI
ncbi:NERD domain-containing protein [Citrus sinensis]|uniref:NERD domain-containing protein n=1 Tax=Citrus sinensis TaxID=2711 RepID=A0ACB8L929_CITSI|nr:NERD domain-containing protein [Citrus sinensis]